MILWWFVDIYDCLCICVMIWYVVLIQGYVSVFLFKVSQSSHVDTGLNKCLEIALSGGSGGWSPRNVCRRCMLYSKQEMEQRNDTSISLHRSRFFWDLLKGNSLDFMTNKVECLTSDRDGVIGSSGALSRCWQVWNDLWRTLWCGGRSPGVGPEGIIHFYPHKMIGATYIYIYYIYIYCITHNAKYNQMVRFIKIDPHSSLVINLQCIG